MFIVQKYKDYLGNEREKCVKRKNKGFNFYFFRFTQILVTDRRKKL